MCAAISSASRLLGWENLGALTTTVTVLAGLYGGGIAGNSVGEAVEVRFVRKVVIREGKMNRRRVAAYAARSTNLADVAF